LYIKLPAPIPPNGIPFLVRVRVLWGLLFSGSVTGVSPSECFHAQLGIDHGDVRAGSTSSLGAPPPLNRGPPLLPGNSTMAAFRPALRLPVKASEPTPSLAAPNPMPTLVRNSRRPGFVLITPQPSPGIDLASLLTSSGAAVYTRRTKKTGRATHPVSFNPGMDCSPLKVKATRQLKI